MSRFLLLLALTLISACSDEQNPVEDNHVWKEQTDMIDKAKGVELLINDAALQQRQLVEEID